MLAVMALLSSAALAAEPPVTIGTPPREINIVDDVGVGDHFPSHVPGSAPYRLPEREPAPRAEQPPEAPQPPVVSEPGEWETIGSAPQAQPQVAAQPQQQAAPTPPVPPQPQVSPPAAAPAPQAPSGAVPDLERETLARASDSLLQGTCEAELPRLAELLDRADRADIRARARILRARCYSQRAKPEKAKAEYLMYLRDNPSGSWVAEARDVAGAP